MTQASIRGSDFTSRLLETGEKPRRFYEYWVTGRGPFPIDMLRYDRCWPADGYSADAIVQAEYGKSSSIKMWSYTEPTIGRWSSFNWTVSGERI